MFKLEGRRLGPYVLGERLGQGGAGVVYAATHGETGQPVALKLLLGPHTEDREFLERFRRETDVIGSLRHPGIVRLLDRGEEPEVGPYLVMERAPGRDLRRLLREEGPLEPARALALAGRVAEALEHAHGHGVVHRDIKPENLMVDEYDGVVVTDFGIARVAEGTSHTRTGLLPGTPDYMSPEQLTSKGGEVGPPADLYALGIVLYEMLTGQTPFASENVAEVIHRQVYQIPPPPSFLRPGLPPGLDDLVLRCLEKKPADRPPSARALRQQVATALDTAATRLVPAPEGLPTLRVAPGAGPPPRPGALWAVPLLLVLAALALGVMALNRVLQPPDWYREAVGSQPVPLPALLAGALTLHGAEAALLPPTRAASGPERARAAGNRLAAALRAGEVERLEGRLEGGNFVLSDREAGEILRVDAEAAALLGGKPEPVGRWWLALVNDHLALRRGEAPEAVAAFERDHPLRPEGKRPVGPLFDRVYRRARHQAREGPLPTEAVVQALESLEEEDREAFQQAARTLPRAVPRP